MDGRSDRLPPKPPSHETVIHRSIARLTSAWLFDSSSNRVNVSQAEEFLTHGLRYVFPPMQEGVTRGIPTAWAATPLKDELTPQDELPPVWPTPDGTTRGIALRPLHPAAAAIHQRDPRLAELLTLADAIRLGGPRIRGLAAKLLNNRLREGRRPAPAANQAEAAAVASISRRM